MLRAGAMAAPHWVPPGSTRSPACGSCMTMRRTPRPPSRSST
jgi:hypothetical protein